MKVIYEDPEPRERDVVFRVVLPQNQILVRPPAVIMAHLNAEKTEQEVVVTNLRSRPLEIFGVTCTSDYVKARSAPLAHSAAGGPERHRIKLTVEGKIPPGKQHSTVVIVTDDENYHELRVPLWLEGPPEKMSSADAPKVYGPPAPRAGDLG